MSKLDDINPQPYRCMTVVNVDGDLVPAYCRDFEFPTKAARDHFVSRYEEECINVYKWNSTRGKKGDRSEIFHASMYTSRE